MIVDGYSQHTILQMTLLLRLQGNCQQPYSTHGRTAQQMCPEARMKPVKYYKLHKKTKKTHFMVHKDYCLLANVLRQSIIFWA